MKNPTRRDFLKQASALVSTSWVLNAYPKMMVFGQEGAERDLVFVVNNGDGSVSVIDSNTDELVKTFPVGTSASFPSNKQFKSGNIIITGLHVDQGESVHIVDLHQGEVVKVIETGSTQNYTETTPDGKFVIVAARFADIFLKLDIDPQSPRFGEIVAELNHFENSQPCDITLSPDGKFAFAPDRGIDTFSVINVESFEVIATVPVPPLVEEPPIEPFMATASRDGTRVFVENIEGQGTVSVFDVGQPEQPQEIKRFTQEDGLGIRPLTDEFTPDGKFNFIINRNSSDLSVVDLDSLEIVNNIELVAEGNPVAGDFSINGEKFYVPIQNQDVVAVVDVEQQILVKTIEVGPQPVGVISLKTTVPPIEGVAIGALPQVAMAAACGLPCCTA